VTVEKYRMFDARYGVGEIEEYAGTAHSRVADTFGDDRAQPLFGDTAYEEALSRCSTERAPWFIIPSDGKWFRNVAVARIAVDYLAGLEIQPPQAAVDLGVIRKAYAEAAGEHVPGAVFVSR
jgi:hypothetical protein